MRFSERIGKSPVRSALQIESIDQKLLNRLWNTIIESFFDKISDYEEYGRDSEKVKVCQLIWKEFFGLPIDQIPTYFRSSKIATEGVISYIREWFYKASWYEVYDLIEFIAVNPTFANECNLALKKEASGYRIIDGRLAQVTSEDEITEIEEALTSTDKWNSVNTHLQSALNFLSDRINPDYRNSIKESISAVESFCKIITGNSSATLGAALSEIEKTHSIHGALKTAFSAIYGYTSDAGGIRHALLENSQNVGFEDAKFMLVSCSAFINYLKAKSNL
jgi:hypothetical protein